VSVEAIAGEPRRPNPVRKWKGTRFPLYCPNCQGRHWVEIFIRDGSRLDWHQSVSLLVECAGSA
jgi:hypothetical protein